MHFDVEGMLKQVNDNAQAFIESMPDEVIECAAVRGTQIVPMLVKAVEAGAGMAFSETQDCAALVVLARVGADCLVAELGRRKAKAK